MPISFWENVENSFARLDSKRVSKSIQTNLMSPDREKYVWLFQHGYGIGASLDGDYTYHARGRRLGQREYQVLLDNALAVNQWFESFGVICVVSRAHLHSPLKQLDFYERHGLSVRFNNVFGILGEDRITHAEYHSFMIEIAQEWLANESSAILVRPVASDVEALLGSPARACFRQFDCNAYILVVDPDGSIYPCDRFAGAPEWQVGHIDSTSLDEAWIASELKYSIIRELMKECASCRWNSVCGGGCKWDRVYTTREEQTDFCSSVSKYFEALVRILNSKGAKVAL